MGDIENGRGGRGYSGTDWMVFAAFFAGPDHRDMKKTGDLQPVTGEGRNEEAGR